MKKYGYALKDFEGLFYKDFRNRNKDCWEEVGAHLERMKELCKERNNLYEKNDLKG